MFNKKDPIEMQLAAIETIYPISFEDASRQIDEVKTYVDECQAALKENKEKPSVTTEQNLPLSERAIRAAIDRNAFSTLKGQLLLAEYLLSLIKEKIGISNLDTAASLNEQIGKIRQNIKNDLQSVNDELERKLPDIEIDIKNIQSRLTRATEQLDSRLQNSFPLRSAALKKELLAIGDEVAYLIIICGAEHFDSNEQTKQIKSQLEYLCQLSDFIESIAAIKSELNGIENGIETSSSEIEAPLQALNNLQEKLLTTNQRISQLPGCPDYGHIRKAKLDTLVLHSTGMLTIKLYREKIKFNITNLSNKLLELNSIDLSPKSWINIELPKLNSELAILREYMPMLKELCRGVQDDTHSVHISSLESQIDSVATGIYRLKEKYSHQKDEKNTDSKEQPVSFGRLPVSAYVRDPREAKGSQKSRLATPEEGKALDEKGRGVSPARERLKPRYSNLTVNAKLGRELRLPRTIEFIIGLAAIFMHYQHVIAMGVMTFLYTHFQAAEAQSASLPPPAVPRRNSGVFAALPTPPPLTTSTAELEATEKSAQASASITHDDPGLKSTL